MTGRDDRCMPVSLLESQLATLAPPSDDEGALLLDATLPIDRLIDRITRAQVAAPPTP